MVLATATPFIHFLPLWTIVAAWGTLRLHLFRMRISITTDQDCQVFYKWLIIFIPVFLFPADKFLGVKTVLSSPITAAFIIIFPNSVYSSHVVLNWSTARYYTYWQFTSAGQFFFITGFNFHFHRCRAMFHRGKFHKKLVILLSREPIQSSAPQNGCFFTVRIHQTSTVSFCSRKRNFAGHSV